MSRAGLTLQQPIRKDRTGNYHENEKKSAISSGPWHVSDLGSVLSSASVPLQS